MKDAINDVITSILNVIENVMMLDILDVLIIVMIGYVMKIVSMGIAEIFVWIENVMTIVFKNVGIIVRFRNAKKIVIIKFHAVKTAKSKKDGLQILMGVLKET